MCHWLCKQARRPLLVPSAWRSGGGPRGEETGKLDQWMKPPSHACSSRTMKSQAALRTFSYKCVTSQGIACEQPAVSRKPFTVHLGPSTLGQCFPRLQSYKVREIKILSCVLMRVRVCTCCVAPLLANFLCACPLQHCITCLQSQNKYPRCLIASHRTPPPPPPRRITHDP